MWKKLRLLLVCLLVALIVAPFVLAFLAIDDHALLTDVPELSSADVFRAKEVLKRSDPRSLADGATATLELPERDLDLVLAYALSRLELGVSRVTLADGAADLAMTLALPDNPIGRYLNVSTRVTAAGQRNLSLDYLKLGRVRIPGWIATWGARQTGKLLRRNDLFDDVWAALDAVEIHPAYASLQYRWQRGLAEDVVRHGRETLSGDVDTELASLYFEEAVHFGADFGASEQVSLARLMGRTFALAAHRSEHGGDPVAENRAAVLGMTVYVLNINPDLILDIDASDPELSHRPEITLLGNHNLAKHFLVSATLTAAAGSVLADAVGRDREILDSEGDDAFRFPNLAADKAGIRFVNRAIGSTDSAMSMQKLMSGQASESLFMPSVSDLPDELSEAEFARQFEGADSEPYERMVAKIEQRIDALPMYR
jgi:hypothetical protein